MKKILLSSLVVIGLNATTLATIDGKAITDSEINSLVGKNFDINKVQKNEKEGILRQVVASKMMLKDAIANGLEKESEFKKELEKVKDQLLINYYNKKILDTIKVSDADLKSFYEKNKAQFTKPATVAASHILVSTEKEAQDIINELKKLKGDALGNKFKEIAMAKSIDKVSGKEGGKLGYFSKGDMVAEFGNTVFAMKNGELSSKPVKSQFGYHVIYRTDSKPEEIMPLKDIKQGLEQNMKLAKFQELIHQKLQNLEKKYKVEYK